MVKYQLFTEIVIVTVPRVIDGKDRTQTFSIPKGDRRFDHICQLIEADRAQEIGAVADLNSAYYRVKDLLNGKGWFSGTSAQAGE